MCVLGRGCLHDNCSFSDKRLVFFAIPQHGKSSPLYEVHHVIRRGGHGCRCCEVVPFCTCCTYESNEPRRPFISFRTMTGLAQECFRGSRGMPEANATFRTLACAHVSSAKQRAVQKRCKVTARFSASPLLLLPLFKWPPSSPTCCARMRNPGLQEPLDQNSNQLQLHSKLCK